MKQTQKRKTRILRIAIVILLTLVTILVFLFLDKPDPNLTTTRGVITEKSHSCGSQILSSDGSIKNSPGICDAGEAVVVNGIRVMTSSGFVADEYRFSYDTDDLRPGDKVQVKYLPTSNNNGTLKCDGCSIKLE